MGRRILNMGDRTWPAAGIGRPRAWSGYFAVAAIILFGMGLRMQGIANNPLWVDEAESSINALAIREHGLPIDRYQGLPLFENTLVRPWPTNPEYEFRDVSYSDKGLATYHSWLPLYVIAGSLALAGVDPDDPFKPPTPEEVIARFDRRTWAPRVPSMIFSLAFLLVLFRFGCELGGEAVGGTALMGASLAHLVVYLGSQARYYSATLLFAAAAGLAAWRVGTRGQRRDFILLGLMLTALFHTHMLAFAVLVLLCGCAFPWLLQHQGALIHSLISAAIIAVGTLPWIVYTGFLDATVHLPKALALMDLPGDLLLYLRSHWDVVVLIGVSFGLLLAAAWAPRVVPQRLQGTVLAHRTAYTFLIAWITFTYITFHLTIPAASFFFERLTLLLEVPAILLLSLLLGDCMTVVAPHRVAVVAPCVMLVFLIVTDRIPEGERMQRLDPVKTRALVRQFSELQPGRDARLFATPNDHLVLQYYTGLPVQSIAPIRASFLNSYPGPVVLAERVALGPGPKADVVRSALTTAGLPADEKQVQNWRDSLKTREIREQLTRRGCVVVPPLEILPDALQAVYENYGNEERLRRLARLRKWARKFPPFRGFSVSNHHDWWTTFFYRFVGPPSRQNDAANYAGRMLGAKAVVLVDADFVFITSPARPENKFSVGPWPVSERP